MKTLRRIYLLSLLTCPLIAFAHGEEVFITLFLEFIVVVIFAIGLLTMNLNGKGKLMISSIYILTTVLTFTIMNRLPYTKYQTIINIGVVALPLTVGVISYLRLKERFRRE